MKEGNQTMICPVCQEPTQNGVIHECEGVRGRRIHRHVEQEWNVRVTAVRGVVSGEMHVGLEINSMGPWIITTDDAIETANMLIMAAKAALRPVRHPR